MHWAVPYIGKKYERGGRGPETFDCWGLLWWIYNHDFHIQIPCYPGILLDPVQGLSTQILKGLSDAWKPANDCFDGAGVAMRQTSNFHHVGIYTSVDGGKIIHAYEGMGVVASTIKELRLRGFKSFNFYRHDEWPT